MSLRMRFLLFISLFILFVALLEGIRGWIYAGIKGDFLRKNIELAGNFLGSEAMLMALGMLKIEESHREAREAMFDPLWRSYLKGEKLSSIRAEAREQGLENPELFVIDSVSLRVLDSTLEGSSALNLDIFRKFFHIPEGVGGEVVHTLPRYEANRGAIAGFVYRYDPTLERYFVLKSDYPSDNKGVRSSLAYASQILHDFQQYTAIKNLFYHIRHYRSNGMDQLSFFNIQALDGLDIHDDLNLVHHILKREDEGLAHHPVRLHTIEGSELYLQRKRFRFGEGEFDLALVMEVDEGRRLVNYDYLWLINRIFWGGVLGFLVMFFWFFRVWFMLPIERIVKRINSKQAIPLALAGNSLELNALIEHRNQLLEELQKENEFSKVLLENQDLFIKDSIHEINTPLSVILLNVGLLELEIGENEYLTHIKSGIRALQSVYGDLSYLLDKEKEGEESEEWVDLGGALRERLEFFRVLTQTDGKSIVLKEKGEAIHVRLNPHKLKRLIDNNLSNAIKHSFAQSSIEVVLLEVEGRAFLSFSNPSAPIKDTEGIFQRYVRGEGAKAGYGMGLSIIKEICEEYEIEIHLSSDTITTFTYIFPINRTSQKEDR